MLSAGNSFAYQSPLRSEQNSVSVSANGVEYVPQTSIVEPQSVLASDVGYRTQNVSSGQAGGVLLTMCLHALPLDVSFSRIRIEEIPDVGGSHVGYFSDVYFMSEWYHGTSQGAGVWNQVVGANVFLMDEAGFMMSLPQLNGRGEVSSDGARGWTSGCLTWDVPCGWASLDAVSGDEPIGVFSSGSQQVMLIDADGDCEVRKHDNHVRREIDGTVLLNGRLMQ